jgi:hypothetical protein
MNTQKKMINQTAIVLVVFGTGLLCSDAVATHFVCPPCTSGTWPYCVPDCSAGEDCCDEENCETCIDNACTVCSGDPNQVCCAGSCCDTSINCQTCANGDCVPCGGDPDLLCCDHITCYDQNDLQCCGWGDGTVCNKFCCDSSECQRCDADTLSCKPALEKAVDYYHLLTCQGTIVPDPDHTPIPNVCGPEGGWYPVPDNPFGYPFGSCCDAHDICYGTCLSSRLVCDGEFYHCMDAVCQSYPSPIDRALCGALRDTYTAAVAEYGEPAWQNGQVAACACCGKLPPS